jgi:putative phosphoesterase
VIKAPHAANGDRARVVKARARGRSRCLILEAQPGGASYSAPMRIALVSDIHANLVALNAVLDDIERRGADQLVCLGDVADLGPQPRETLARLRDLGCPIVQGNHDPFTEPFPGLEGVVAWCRERLGDDGVHFLRQMPATLEVELAPGVTLLCVHGSPESYDFQLVAETPEADLLAWPLRKDVVAVVAGHTHLQLLRRVHGRTFVNVGSVGQPFDALFDGKRPPRCLRRAEYAIVEWKDGALGVELCSIPLDFEAYARAVRDVGFPNPDEWLRHWDERG